MKSSKVFLFNIFFLGLIFVFDDAQAATCASGEVGGEVFRDININGSKDSLEPSFDGTGLSVKAYSSSGTLLGTAVVDSSGQYSLGTIATSGGVRLELTGLPSYVKAGVVGTQAASEVLFITANGCDYDFAVHNPAQYCQSAPDISMACYVNGAGTTSTAASLVSVNYADEGTPLQYGGSGPNPTSDIETAETGSVWGGDYQRSTQRLFVAATLKRHVGVGPEGLGGIYVVDYSSSSPTLAASFTLDGVTPLNGGGVINTGTVTRSVVSGAIAGDNELSTDASRPSIDLDAYVKVGTTGLGDAALEEDGQTLWVVNLSQKALISVDVSGASSALPGDINQYLFSALSGVPSCSGGVLRPFAIQFHDSVGYLGAVCDASTSQDPADLFAYVLSFDPANMAAGFTTEISFSLNYTREPLLSSPPGATALGSAIFGRWRAWHTDYVTQIIAYYTQVTVGPLQAVPQPILSNIRFTENGSMVLGLTDRFSQQAGYQNYYPVSATSLLLEGISGGDILQVCNVAGSWVLEGQSGCASSDTDSLLTNDGPSAAGEFYHQDELYIPTYTRALSTHAEVAIGGLAIVPGSGEVLSTSFDPITNSSAFRTNGFRRYSTSTGDSVAEYMIVPDSLLYPQYFGKAGGLGEPIIRCAAAPIEIGNRLWIDADSDGIQDPGEEAISGVDVQLCDSGNNILATATTDTNGNFYFSSASGTSTDSRKYSLSGLSASTTDYKVRIAVNQSELSGYLLTSANSDSTTNGDQRDSDCTSDGTYASISVNTGVAGATDHTFDCGFTPDTCAENFDSEAATIDGALDDLNTLVSRSVSLRAQYERYRLCPRTSASSRAATLAAAQEDYSDGWTTVWGSLELTDYTDCERSSLTCSNVSNVTAKASILESGNALVARSRNILNASCLKRQARRTLSNRRRQLLNQVTATLATLDSRLDSYSDTVRVCS